jgi:hypothetical protein
MQRWHGGRRQAAVDEQRHRQRGPNAQWQELHRVKVGSEMGCTMARSVSDGWARAGLHVEKNSGELACRRWAAARELIQKGQNSLSISNSFLIPWFESNSNRIRI